MVLDLGRLRLGIQVGPHRVRVGLTIDLDREVGRLVPFQGTWCESQSVSDSPRTLSLGSSGLPSTTTVSSLSAMTVSFQVAFMLLLLRSCSILRQFGNAATADR